MSLSDFHNMTTPKIDFVRLFDRLLFYLAEGRSLAQGLWKRV